MNVPWIDRRRLSVAGMVLAPVLGLCVVRVWMESGGPSRVSAGTGRRTQSDEPIPAPEPPSPEQVAAAQYARANGTRPFGATPFYYPPDEPVATVAGDPGPGDAAIEPLDVDLYVTSVIGGATPMAVINGRPLRVGARVGAGWTLAEIDADGRCVVVRHDDGRERRAEVAGPR